MGVVSPLVADKLSGVFDVEDPQDLASRAFVMGFVARQNLDFAMAREFYEAALALDPDIPGAAAITEEIHALWLLENGWTLKPLAHPAMELRLLEKLYPVTPPVEFARLLEAFAESFPHEWRIFALKARNHVRAGRLIDASEALEQALAIGGEQARIATSTFALDLDSRLQRLSPGLAVIKNVGKGSRKEIADLLATVWRNDPELVEFGIEACREFARNRNFTECAALAAEVRDYLKKDLSHPRADTIPLLQFLAENSQKLAALQEKKASSRKTVSQKPTKKTPQKSSSMAERFRSLSR